MLTSLSLTSGIFAFSNKAILGLLLNNLALFPNAKVGIQACILALNSLNFYIYSSISLYQNKLLKHSGKGVNNPLDYQILSLHFLLTY